MSEYRSSDRDGHVQATKQLKVHADTTHPVTAALANATVVRGHLVTTRFRVHSAIAPEACGKIKIHRAARPRHARRFRCGWPTELHGAFV